MGRYVILLVAPIIIGVLIAAALVAINGLRQRHIDERLALLEERRPEDESSDLTHRRIAS